MTQFQEWFLLTESKQEIINMGFPEIISKLFYEGFGKTAPIIAKWYKDYHNPGNRDDQNWWRIMMWNSFRGDSLYQLTYLYEATKDPESYEKAAKFMDVGFKADVVDDHYLIGQRESLLRQIKDVLSNDEFFKSKNFIKDIIGGKLKNLAPYKGMTFQEAEHKYDERNIFDKTKPVKVYPNGFKWINVGTSSPLIANLMNNCGGTGLMSTDPDRSMVVLFGPDNKPHVVVTYSPNQKRISGDEGGGSSPVKDNYHDYVLDLAETLGVEFDADKSKSKLLAIKYNLRGRLQGIKQLNDPKNSFSDDSFLIQIDGKSYYTDGYMVISQEDTQKVQDLIQRGELNLRSSGKTIVDTVLDRQNMGYISSHGVQYLPLKQFSGP